MGRIRIDFSAVKAANAELSKVAVQIEALADNIDFLRKCLDPQILARHQIDLGLISCTNSATIACARARKLHSSVNSSVEKYQVVESKLSHSSPDNSKVR